MPSMMKQMPIMRKPTMQTGQVLPGEGSRVERLPCQRILRAFLKGGQLWLRMVLKVSVTNWQLATLAISGRASATVMAAVISWK